MLPLRIHCWGGLGSQLLAVALLLDLETKFPSRRLILVLHQGGVTLRTSEIDSLFIDIETHSVLDFSSVPSEASSDSKNKFRLKIRDVLKVVLRKCSIVLPLSNDQDFQKIRRFTLSIRGHYSYRSISKDTVNRLLQRLDKSARSVYEAGSGYSTRIGVHYRLGDLLTLDTKQPLEETRVVSVIENLIRKDGQGAFTVFSDSPTIAKSIMEKYFAEKNVHCPEGTTWIAISNLVHSDYFVGTFSKVSLWIVILRYYFRDGVVSFMPLEARENIQKFLGSNFDEDKISFF